MLAGAPTIAEALKSRGYFTSMCIIVDIWNDKHSAQSSSNQNSIQGLENGIRAIVMDVGLSVH